MKTALRALALVALVAAGACTGDSSGGGSGGTTTTWVGLVQGSDGIESGSLSITVQTASPRIVGPGTGIALAAPTIVEASGTYKRTAPTAATVDLTGGTYNTETKALSVGGGGYLFTGVYDGQSRLEGTFTGGAGGNFVTEKNTANAQVFCGTFSGDDDGTWSIVVQSGQVHGQAQSSSGGAPIALDGVVSGNTITIYAPGSTTIELATGTISGNTASGTWTDPETQATGTWTGSTSCQ